MHGRKKRWYDPKQADAAMKIAKLPDGRPRVEPDDRLNYRQIGSLFSRLANKAIRPKRDNREEDNVLAGINENEVLQTL
jgi:hypothetical protein